MERSVGKRGQVKIECTEMESVSRRDRVELTSSGVYGGKKLRALMSG